MKYDTKIIKQLIEGLKVSNLKSKLKILGE